MKKMSCDRCDYYTSGETFEDWMSNLMPHYIQSHVDVMSNLENKKAEQHSWMEKNRARFNELI